MHGSMNIKFKNDKANTSTDGPSFAKAPKAEAKTVNSGNLLKIKKAVHVNRKHVSLQENTTGQDYLILYNRFTCTLETHRIHCIVPGWVTKRLR
jgi:hypothetical protein